MFKFLKINPPPGITVPVNSRVFISSCKLCKCVQPVSHHGPRLVCYWREQCVRTGPVPGEFLSSLPFFLVLLGKLFSLGLFILLVILYIFRL